jgi:dimethylargininase
MPTALVRRPGPRLDEGIVTFEERRPVDLDLATEQWERYVDVLRRSGWDVVTVDPADDCPDAVFVEDAVTVRGGVAVLTRPGAAVRRDEVPAVATAIERCGLPARRIEPPGTLDGGDVLQVGDDVVYVGQGGRTNGEGIRQLRAVLRPLGFRVVAVPVRSVLHLKSAVTALPDGTVIGYPPLVDHRELFPSFLEVPEPSGAHVVVLDDERLLLAADAPKTAELLDGLGYVPVTVDIGEFQKLEGCVTCLSVRIRSGRR